ncbi:cupin domain-containing protein [Paractinoplanes lichenicola]|uniref:Cupin domain-containing protein n=1 Tax=Paractinoplanes lichenicola TaxID=2802976 RepID=A0ABS1VSZ8_9ACTN|nr:cupin domain-containing protein [Actinoplanes lichenicola]MBL7257594.1 cupin domain-containing protein [Actinoplanes lichenicola]
MTVVSSESGVLHVPAGEGLVKWMSGDVLTFKATKAETNGSLAFMEALVPPGGGPVAHLHPHSDEAFYLIDGALEFLDGERTFIAEPGSFVYIPRNHRHRFKNLEKTDARLVFLFTPAGPEDLFLEGADDPIPGQRPENWTPERFARLTDIVERTGDIMLPEGR